MGQPRRRGELAASRRSGLKAQGRCPIREPRPTASAVSKCAPHQTITSTWPGAHVQPWVAHALCDAVERHPAAQAYAALARFTRAFIEVETQAFDLIE